MSVAVPSLAELPISARAPADASLRASWAERVGAVVEDLAALHLPSEEAFLAIGEQLRAAHASARNLAVIAAALALRLAEPEFQDTLQGLGGAVALVERLRASGGGRARILSGIAGDAEDIRKALEELAQVMVHIGVLGVNAKIEAAQMTATGMDFTVFTHEILRLAAHGREVVERALHDRDRLSAAAAEATALQAGFETTHLRNLAQVSDRLAGSIAAMRSRERQAVATLEQLPHDLDAVHDRIGALVMDLQIGDISRQRLEHVEHALTILMAVLEGGDAAREGELSDSQSRVLANAVCHLQYRQLGQIETELTTRMAGILSNLRQLVDTIDAIRTRTADVYSGDDGGGSTFLLDVDRDLERVAGVVAHYIEATMQTERSLDEVMAAAAAMRASMQAIRDIDADINVVGLNASIRCGRLGGRGRALNVIAQELRAYARQTRTLSAGVAKCLEHATRDAGSLAQDKFRDGDHDLERLRSSLGLSVERLRQSGGETAWVLSHIQERAATVEAALREVVTRLDVHQRYAAVVGSAAQVLAALADEASPGLSGDALERTRRDVLRFMEAHYTMARERDIHDLFLSGKDEDAPRNTVVDGKEAAGAFDPSDLLF